MTDKQRIGNPEVPDCHAKGSEDMISEREEGLLIAYGAHQKRIAELECQIQIERSKVATAEQENQIIKRILAAEIAKVKRSARALEIGVEYFDHDDCKCSACLLYGAEIKGALDAIKAVAA